MSSPVASPGCKRLYVGDEGYDPRLLHRTPLSLYIHRSRMWYNLAPGPEPCLMEGIEFAEWMEGASPEELEFLASQDHEEIFALAERFEEDPLHSRNLLLTTGSSPT